MKTKLESIIWVFNLALACSMLASLNPDKLGEWVIYLKMPAGIIFGVGLYHLLLRRVFVLSRRVFAVKPH